MPREEITGQRPANYSLWHRRVLPEWCYMTDGDWFEQRKKGGSLQVVAYMETVEVPLVQKANLQYSLWPSKIALCEEIAARMRIPVYVVWHNPSCTEFLVVKIGGNNVQRLNAQQYIDFIQHL